MPRNYYLILGIPHAADPDAVRDAYRRLVKRYHPDRTEGDAHLFMDIHEAYEVLSDPARRRQYDESLEKARVFRPRGHVVIEPVAPARAERRRGVKPVERKSRLGESARRGPEPLPASERWALGDLQTVGWLLDEWFEGEWEHFFAGALQGGPEVYAGEIVLSSADAARGGQVSLRIPARRTCPACRGSGGEGWYACARCAGSGEIERDIPLTLQFPPGIHDKYRWIMPLDRYGISGHRLEILFRVADQY